MLRFTQLYTELDQSNRTNDKLDALRRYFGTAPPEDAAWAVYFLIGAKIPRGVNSTQLRRWAAEAAGLPDWLVDESYAAVGDLAETIALLLPEPAKAPASVARTGMFEPPGGREARECAGAPLDQRLPDGSQDSSVLDAAKSAGSNRNVRGTEGGSNGNISGSECGLNGNTPGTDLDSNRNILGSEGGSKSVARTFLFEPPGARECAGALSDQRLPDGSHDSRLLDAAKSAGSNRNVRGTESDSNGNVPGTDRLHVLIENHLIPLRELPETERRAAVLGAWAVMDRRQRLVYNKILTGSFRVGVSKTLVIKALAQHFSTEPAVMAHRLMGTFAPTAHAFLSLAHEDSMLQNPAQPYPFFLASPVPDDFFATESPTDFQAEWKWDGIRCQLIKRMGQVILWSRGEDLLTDRFPEVRDAADALPDGTVLDGELLAWDTDRPAPFQNLQPRINRKTVSQKMLKETPAAFMAYDVMELNGEDLRDKPLSERRALLEELASDWGQPSEGGTGFQTVNDKPEQAQPTVHGQDAHATPSQPAASTHANSAQPAAHVPADRAYLYLSPVVHGDTWEALSGSRGEARGLRTEGLMLKRHTSPYRAGRTRGDWWKWKVDPYTIDAVLTYAQPGHGRRAGLFTDYTFGIWDGDQLITIAKAYSGLNNAEINEVDGWVRKNTLEKFGPVRMVTPELVFELAFEGLQTSNRNKSGIAVRFPRIQRWRKDKPASQADTVQRVKDLLSAHQME